MAFKMTDEDKQALAAHRMRMVLHLSAEDQYTMVRRCDSLGLTITTYTPKKYGMVDPMRKAASVYSIDDCGDFDSGSDALYVLKETGRLSRNSEGHHPNQRKD